tara:strand:- start:594 stop:1103 length:510 start_codon:yes stop_codon:yes gene_type:complete
MKIILADIKSGFNNKIFNISANSIPDRGTKFINQNIKLLISGYSKKDDYIIKGQIETQIESVCARCLEKKSITQRIPIKLIIKNKDYIESEYVNTEVIYLTKNEENINLNLILADLIALSRPIKPLCKSICKGLCIICGKNKNEILCNCQVPRNQEIWDKLKTINNKFS